MKRNVKIGGKRRSNQPDGEETLNKVPEGLSENPLMITQEEGKDMEITCSRSLELKPSEISLC